MDGGEESQRVVYGSDSEEDVDELETRSDKVAQRTRSSTHKEADYSDHVWVISCRSARTLDQFSKRMLMFQPDIRAFCPKGTRCPNQDDEIHQALYIHEKRPKDRSETQLVGGSGVKKNPRIPHVSRAYVLMDGLRKRAPSSLLDGVPRDSVFVVFVHGFSESFPRIIGYLNHMGQDSIFSAKTKRPIRRCGFVWPSQSVSYFRARFFAEKAGKQLRHALETLKRHGNKIVLVAHSMGCRVSLHSLLEATSPDLVEHLLLIGAGVASDYLNEKGRFPASQLSAKRITVLYSRRDLLLRSNFPMAEFLPGLWNFRPIAATQALGGVGCAPGSRDAKVDQFDCTKEVEGHSTHFYLNSSIAVSKIRMAIMTAAEMHSSM